MRSTIQLPSMIEKEIEIGIDMADYLDFFVILCPGVSNERLKVEVCHIMQYTLVFINVDVLYTCTLL